MSKSFTLKVVLIAFVIARAELYCFDFVRKTPIVWFIIYDMALIWLLSQCDRTKIYILLEKHSLTIC